jgi:iron(III) transport system substrate-binding protein
VLEGAGLLAGAPHPEEAKLFLDWLFGEDAAKVFDPFVGAAAVPGYGSVDLAKVHLWKMRRPLDANEFKRQWAAKYEK